MKERVTMKQNNMLAMILAGGRGTRLHELTKKMAKPAVSYGGKYRIIDFPSVTARTVESMLWEF